MKTFQEVLEQRVQKNSKIQLDRHTIEKAARDIIFIMFGKLGKRNIKINTWTGGVLALECCRSTWRNEIFLNKENIKNETTRNKIYSHKSNNR